MASGAEQAELSKLGLLLQVLLQVKFIARGFFFFSSLERRKCKVHEEVNEDGGEPKEITERTQGV